ncbi:MAG: alpha/beta hydrolase [Bacteriovorax sp.]|nr:alpha/beta hydrolase [Bacteriovorax sp.]
MKNVFIILTSVLINTACASNILKPIEGISNHLSIPIILQVGEGSITFEDSMGPGPVIVCIPGMGDTRGQFRFIAPLLVKAGYRVITVDPRGQGNSDATFSSYTASAVGEDIIKLIDQLGTDVFVMGNSSGGASAAWVAGHLPQKVKGVIFIAAFLRDHPLSLFNRILLQAALRGPWAASSWITYYDGLFISVPPKDQERYTNALKESLNQEGHILALRQMVFASKSDVEVQLKDIKSPVLAIGGSKDPDFLNPEDEINWILKVLTGEKAMIAGAGHYPHLEYPDQILKLVDKFIKSHKN